MENTVPAMEGVVAPEATPTAEVTPDEQKQPDSSPEKESQDKEKSAQQKRIDQLTREKYEARGQTKAERSARLDLERRVEELNKVDPEPERQPTRDELARQIRAEERFNLRVEKLAAEGVKTIPDFKKVVANLTMIGLENQHLEVLMESDEPAKVLRYLNDNLDEADEILSKSPIAMARAIARLETKLSTTPAISNAPKPLEPTRSKSTPGEPEDISAWMERENAKDAKRRANR